MAITDEPTNVGLGESAHAKMRVLVEDEHFDKMVDAYKFAVAYAALKVGADAPEVSGSHQNVFGVATLDADRSLYEALRVTVAPSDGSVYKYAEKLADWGIHEISRLASKGEFTVLSTLAREVSH